MIGDQHAQGMGSVARMEAAIAVPGSWGSSATSASQASSGSIAILNAMSRTRAWGQAAAGATANVNATASPALTVSVVYRVASSVLRGDTVSNAMSSAPRRLPALLTEGAARTGHASVILGSWGKIAGLVIRIYSGRAARSGAMYRLAEDGDLVIMRASVFATPALRAKRARSVKRGL